MSNFAEQFNEWEQEEKARELEWIQKYPFLRRRNSDGTINTEHDFPMMFLEIPFGWQELFFQMCDDIKDLVPEDFYFLQVKEKYNYMRCYATKCSAEVEAIIAKYEQMAYYVCTYCGKPATFETSGYLASFCDDCWKDHVRHDKGEWIKFEPSFTVTHFNDGEHTKETISFKDEWERYLKRIKHEQ